MLRNEHNLILKAKKTTSISELISLSKSPYSNVRSSVAKNSYCSSEIINKLAYDSVLRVSYWALKNQKCQIKRKLRDEDLKHKCISCLKDESEFIRECNKCSKNIY